MIQNLKKILNNSRVIFLKNNKIILGDNSKTNAKHKIIKKYSKIKKPVELTRIEIIPLNSSNLLIRKFLTVSGKIFIFLKRINQYIFY